MDKSIGQPPAITSTPWQRVKQNIPSEKAKKLSVWAVVILSILGIVYYWWYTTHYVSTDDAYVNANVVQIGPQVTGQVLELPIINNQYVEKGSLLFKIDPAPFIAAVNQAQAQVDMSDAKTQIAQLTATRYQEMLQRNAISQQDVDTANANLKSAAAAADLARAQLTQAQLDLQYTTLTAPTNGWVSNMSLRVGDIVAADRPLFAFISDDEFWIDTNFKETQLQYVKLGHEAVIENDVYPGKKFKGIVESISGASGNAFSLLPPQNATGNWVKIVQRVPVRVRVIDRDPNFPLRVGTSTTVTIAYTKEPIEQAQQGIAP